MNCREIASLSTQLSLASSCVGSGCIDAEYKWQLFTVDVDGSVIPEKLIRDMTDTKLNNTGIVIKQNELKKGLRYRLQVTVSPKRGQAVGQSTYEFRTNAPPHSGRCTVSPTTGEALKTKFTISCKGWLV